MHKALTFTIAQRFGLALLMAAGGVAMPALAADAPAAGQVVFVAGPAWRVAPDGLREPLQAGASVRPGDHIATGADAHVHLRMSDNAFVAVRPQSQLGITLYEYDPAQPAASRIKLELLQGNTRAVSGKGGEAAKHNYRFNTPLAAIGLRGTDYTVFSGEDATRVSVARGAVAVTPLGDGCVAAALGPCATAATRELSAGLSHAYLEVNARQHTPVLVRPEQDPAGAAGQNPASRPEEPRASNPASGATASSGTKDAANLVAADRLLLANAPPPVAPRPQELFWGRWSSYAQGEGAPSVLSLLTPEREVAVGNDVFGLMRSSAPISLPGQGVFSFQMAASEAYSRNATGTLMPASVTGGSFSIDFNQRSFDTTLAVVHNEGAEQLRAAGNVQFQGQLLANPAKSNMTLNGLVANGGSEAAYLFDKTLSTGGGLLGAVRWVR